MNDFTKKIVDLYSQGLSLTEISQKLKFSVHKVTYWMEKSGTPRRSMSDAQYLKNNPNGDPFCIKTLVKVEDIKLHWLGMGIYWGEGNKANRTGVIVSNTDSGMLLTFIQFLTQICGVKKDKIKYSIVCFNDSDPNAVVEHWSKVFEISREKFGKIVQIPPQGKGTYTKKSEFGVCTVSVFNTKFKQWMLSALDTIRHSYQF